MTMSDCNLFKRSFTNKGIGFTFNNERKEKVFKEHYKSPVFFFNSKRKPSLMKSASSKHALKAVVENNVEEVERFDRTKSPSQPEGDLTIEPTEISISLHNPKEPADLRSDGLKIPLGHSTTVYIWPKIREIDHSGKQLSESQRNCRLDEDIESLDIFKVYTRAACMFECKMKFSTKRCGCIPWNYPLNNKEQVSIFIFKIFST